MSDIKQLNLFEDTDEYLNTITKRYRAVVDFVTSNYKWVRYNTKTVNEDQKMRFVISCMLTAGTNEVNALLACKQIDNVWEIEYEQLLQIANKCKIPFAENKCKQVINTRDLIKFKHEKCLPASRNVLESFPGIGHHVASVILATLFDKPEFAVDLHVKRILTRLGLAPTNSNTEIAFEKLIKIYVPNEKLGHFSRALVDFGQDICGFKPRCNLCPLDCPSRNKNNKSNLTIKRQEFEVKYVRNVENPKDINAVFVRQGQLKCTCNDYTKSFKCAHVEKVRSLLNTKKNSELKEKSVCEKIV